MSEELFEEAGTSAVAIRSGSSAALSESRIVTKLASAVANRLVARAIRFFQGRGDGLQSGEDSGLKNLWNEYCVQVQGEHSVFWSSYRSELEAFLRHEIAHLPACEAGALWLQTANGEDWSCEPEEERLRDPVCHDDVIDYLMMEVDGAAADWTNPRIRRYLDRWEPE